MSDGAPPAAPPRRKRTPKAFPDPHADMHVLIATLARQADAFEQVIPIVPVLIEMATAWQAGKNVGATAKATGGLMKWVTSNLVVPLAILWALFHGEIKSIFGIHSS